MKLKNEPGNSLMGKAGLPRERGSADLLAIAPAWSRSPLAWGLRGDMSV